MVRTVVITGASAGIGKAAALAFAARGDTVMLMARRSSVLESVRQDIAGRGGSAMAIPCDVSNHNSVKDACGIIYEKIGCPDILVNNAGFAVFKNVQDADAAGIESQMATNYMGMIHMTKAFLDAMVLRGSGHIVNVASVAASFGLPGVAPYCATKWAMLGFSEGLRHELAGTGVGVTVVSPITVRTEFFGDKPIPKYSVSAEAVAKSILRASESNRAEITVPEVARLAIWAKHSIPYITEYAISRYFRRNFPGRT